MTDNLALPSANSQTLLIQPATRLQTKGSEAMSTQTENTTAQELRTKLLEMIVSSEQTRRCDNPITAIRS